MPKVLSEAAVEQYRTDGFYFPIDVLSEEEAKFFRGKLEEFETAQGHPLEGPQRIKTNLLFTWMDELMRDPRILDPIEDLIGGNILSWGAHMFVKEANTTNFVSWHQDNQYWGLDSDDVLTAWLALSPATLEAGAMKMLPGSHKVAMKHEDTYDSSNMLTRGQHIVDPIDEDKAVDLVLKTGQMSLHNVKIAHASPPNRSNDRRIGIAFRMMPTSTRQQMAEWDSATLVRGVDEYKHFVEEPRPARDMDPEAVAFHRKTIQNEMNVLYKGAQKRPEAFRATA